MIFEDKIIRNENVSHHPIDLSAFGRGLYQLSITIDEQAITKTLIIE